MRRIHATGEFTQSDWDKLGVRIQAALVTAGVTGVQIMRDKVADPIVTGTTTNSITWQTSTKGSAPKKPASKENTLDKPSDPYTVSIGSKEPALVYRELGSGRHEKDTGTEEFIESMEEWVMLVLGKNAKGPPEDRDAFWRIVKHIRDNGTEARPFLDATKAELNISAEKIFRRVIHKFLIDEGKRARRK